MYFESVDASNPFKIAARVMSLIPFYHEEEK